MKKHLHLDEQTWEALESCPSGVCDVADPAMAHLSAQMAANPELQKVFDRIEHLDGKIAAAFQDVSLPPGLDSTRFGSFIPCTDGNPGV